MSLTREEQEKIEAIRREAAKMRARGLQKKRAKPPSAVRKMGGSRKFEWRDFFGFRYMITPEIMSFVFLVGAFSILIGAALAPSPMRSWWSEALAVFAGVIIWRIFCELLVVAFSINNRLAELVELEQERSAGSADD